MIRTLKFMAVVIFCLSLLLACSEGEETTKANVHIENNSGSLVLITLAEVDGSDIFEMMITAQPDGYPLANNGVLNAPVPEGIFDVTWSLCNTSAPVDCIGDDSPPGADICKNQCESNALCYTDAASGVSPADRCDTVTPGIPIMVQKELVAGQSYTIIFTNIGPDYYTFN